MGVWQTKEEFEEMLELIEKEMPFFVEGKKLYQDMLNYIDYILSINVNYLKRQESISGICANTNIHVLGLDARRR